MEYSKVELLAFIKKFNKNNEDKIRNADKLKKEELYNICKHYSLIECNDSRQSNTISIFENLSKEIILQNIEIHLLKNNQPFLQSFTKMKKKDLLDYIVKNHIKHYTPSMIKQETIFYERQHKIKNILYYNAIRYGHDIKDVDYDNFQEYIANNDLDTNIDHLCEYTELFERMYSAYDAFCKKMGADCNIKSLPELVDKIHRMTIK